MTSACDPGLLHPRETRAEFCKNNLTHMFCAGYLEAVTSHACHPTWQMTLHCYVLRKVVRFLISTAVNLWPLIQM